ncbi:hypothetical protein [Sphingomonas yunnanensis]|uniref:hypothetical protein n=1 Tax=Sphingomonas yunnanensis TaxID=310400 RepID=UPI001CA62C8A|nr:hypothetical protein [Sphingomonas yunnanensis]
MNIFVAGVQYDDFEGTVAADIAENSDLLRHLEELGLAQQGERIAAVRLTASSLSPGDVEDCSLVAYLCSAASFEERPSEVRAVETRITPAKLLSFYKRFDLVMVRKSMDLSSSTVDGPHY